MPHKKTLHQESGSALLVTIMITSVVLIFSMILLERIVPYAQQIRGMEESLQAYYTARGSIEEGLLAFNSLPIRTNIGNEAISGASPLQLSLPDIGPGNIRRYIVVSSSSNLPLNIDLFSTDSGVHSFGTNLGNPLFHTLTSFGGGVMFDLSGVDTYPFDLLLETDTTIAGIIAIEFVYSDSHGTIPFFASVPISSRTSTDLMQAKNTDSGKILGTDFLNTINCNTPGSRCSLKLWLVDADKNSIGIKLTSNVSIPDLNAILVGDAISPTGSYHARLVTLIPVTQSL